MDHLAGVDGDYVRGRVGGANEATAVSARKVTAPEIAVAVEKPERGGADGDLTDRCGRERTRNGDCGPVAGHVRGFSFQRLSIGVYDERVRIADFDLLDGLNVLINPSAIRQFRAPDFVYLVHVKVVRATDGHLDTSSVAVIGKTPVARAVDGTTPHVSAGRAQTCVRDSDERIVASVKVNHGALGDAVGYGIVGCRNPVIARELIEVGVARPGESSSHGI